MPELVEVFVIAERLNKNIKNTTLIDISIISGRYKNTLPKNYKEFSKSLPLEIENVSSQGKFIYITFEGGASIWITLGLTGDVYMKNPDFDRIQYMNGIDRKDVHDRVSFTIKKGRSEDFVYFNDIRNFGTITFSLDKKELDKKLLTLGRDPLREDITMVEFIDIFQAKKRANQNKMICLELVNQKLIAGIGNYLRAEILYDANISPFIKVKDLSKNDLESLWKAMNHIISIVYKKEINNLEYSPLIYGRIETDKGEKVLTKSVDDRTIWYV